MMRINLLPYRWASFLGSTTYFWYWAGCRWRDKQGRPCDSQMGLMGEKGYSKDTGRPVYTDDYPLFYVYGSAAEREAQDTAKWGQPRPDFFELRATKTPLTKVIEEDSLLDVKDIVDALRPSTPRRNPR